MSRWIRLDDELARESPSVRAIGGKGAGLVRLRALGCPVPRFGVITTEAWRASSSGDAAPEGLTPAIRETLEVALTTIGAGPYAVRSSGVVEDGTDTSWAGQFESVLGAPDADAVVAAVATCWASASSERVLAYGALHGVEVGEMAVVVQRLVHGQASGVLFTRDPDDPGRSLVSVGLGLGEGVVQGQVPCDTFRVARDGTITSELADKDEAVRLVDGQVRSVPVEGAPRTAPALDASVLTELVRWGWRLEEALGAPMDIEFTVDDGALFLLQVRPITVPIPVGRRLLWDNSNIVESYSGMTTPLTFSFASSIYTIVYQLFCQVMGVDPETIRANEPTFRRMIGLMRGRIYYNLNAWYRVLSLLPGFSFNREAMETMMGVSEVASDEDAGAQDAPRWVEGLKLSWLLTRLGWRLLRLERDAAAFQTTFDETLAMAKAKDLGSLRLDELLALYEEIERKLLWGWTPPLVNDFFCMIFYKLLQKRCEALTGDPETQLHNRLLAGEGTLASAAPAIELRRMLDLARQTDGVRLALASDRSDDQVLREVLENPRFRAHWDRWMDRYGDRSPDELKLESDPLTDTPEFVLSTLRAWLRDGGRNLRALGTGDPEKRAEAEAEAEALLDTLRQRLGFRFVLRQARRRVGMRESLRFERTRVFGIVRRIFRAFGDRFVASGHLDTRADIHYLTVEEILGFVRGTTATTNLRGLAALRRAEFEGFATDPVPSERFHTWGAVHVANRFYRPVEAGAPVSDHEITGTPCSPGQVTAAARVVTDPRQRPDLEGGILVAHRTDPGWVPLFPTASAVIVERGSLLSHSAVVARELGLPAIVGVRGLLDWVEDGELLSMDGGAGRIWRETGEDTAGG